MQSDLMTSYDVIMTKHNLDEGGGAETRIPLIMD